MVRSYSRTTTLHVITADISSDAGTPSHLTIESRDIEDWAEITTLRKVRWVVKLLNYITGNWETHEKDRWSLHIIELI